MQNFQGSKAASGAIGGQGASSKTLTDLRITKDLGQLRGIVECEFAKAMKAKEGLDKRREARFCLAKAGNSVQVFMSDFSKFLEAYSGLCNVAKAADAKFGGLVTESLSLLLVVSVE